MFGEGEALQAGLLKSNGLEVSPSQFIASARVTIGYSTALMGPW